MDCHVLDTDGVCIARVVKHPEVTVRTDHPLPEATERTAQQAAGGLSSTAGYFVPTSLTKTDHLMNVEHYTPYLMHLWMCYK